MKYNGLKINHVVLIELEEIINLTNSVMQ